MRSITGICVALSFLILAGEQAEAVVHLETLAEVPTADLLEIALPEQEESTTTVKVELSDIFKNNGCPLPPEVTKKLAKKTTWIPRAVEVGFGETLDDPIQSTSYETLRKVLHVALIPKGKPREKKYEPLELTGSTTYLNFEPLTVIDTGEGDLVYSYDCSGFLNATA